MCSNLWDALLFQLKFPQFCGTFTFNSYQSEGEVSDCRWCVTQVFGIPVLLHICPLDLSSTFKHSPKSGSKFNGPVAQRTRDKTWLPCSGSFGLWPISMVWLDGGTPSEIWFPCSESHSGQLINESCPPLSAIGRTHATDAHSFSPSTRSS